MKVFFIVPPELHFIEAYNTKKVDKGREFRQKLGILAVAGYLRDVGGITPRIIDSLADMLSLEDIRKILKKEQPDIVGFSVLTFNILDCLEVVRIISEVSPATKVCFGGFHPTIYPLETLSLPGVDFIVMGEGEITFTELVLTLKDSPHAKNKEPGNLKELGGETNKNKTIPILDLTDSSTEKKKGFAAIDGLGWKDQKGRPILNAPRKPVAKLDTFPMPAHDLIDLEKYSLVLAEDAKVASIQTSRGCPSKCTFCDIRLTRYRYRSAEHVMEEIKFLTGLGIREFFFLDDTFTINKKRVYELCNLLIESKLDIKYKISSRVDRVNQEMLDMLAASGCYRIHYGVETGSQRLLDYLEKGVTLEQTINAFKMTKKAGIETFAYMMIGIPTETKDDIEQTIQFVNKLQPDRVNYSICSPFPKTKLYETALNNDPTMEDYWGEFAKNPEPNFKIRTLNEYFTQEELRNIQDKALKRFYFSPRQLAREIYHTRSFKQLLLKAKFGMRFLSPRFK
ncbi:radical SAM domain-containing protein [Candidatus Thiomargarita nelsonii]|uniref:Radical SAM domain-containing protein n=1 Tax=Candidatus Thiomargarita nelsonii TaxID=1003181 RepID=A0A0A6P0V5_9GAMM|nr:radical SAM domain-containing protein [Candidatus Thiomargarita nelsonii]